ncbi:MAG: hypothetical protein KBT31_06930 [Firmicutes bacterium]|nr:hypothetical protein [Candidatus Colimorpha enterica]
MKRFLKIILPILLILTLVVGTSAKTMSDNFDKGFLTFDKYEIQVNATTQEMYPRMTADGKGGFFLHMENNETIGTDGGYFADNLAIYFDPWGECGDKFVVMYNLRINTSDYGHDAGDLLFEVQFKSDQGWNGNFAPFGVRADGKGGAYMGCIRDTETDNMLCEIGKWYNIACAYDMKADTVDVYVNGEKAYTTYAKGGDEISAYTLMLIGITDATYCPFNFDFGDLNVFTGSSPADFEGENELPRDADEDDDTDADTEDVGDVTEDAGDETDAEEKKPADVKGSLITAPIILAASVLVIVALILIFTKEN